MATLNLHASAIGLACQLSIGSKMYNAADMNALEMSSVQQVRQAI